MSTIAIAAPRSVSPTWRRFRDAFRRHPTAIIGGAVLLAIALMALTRASIENVILAITLAEVPRVVRLVRSLVLSLREEPYVEAAIAAGTSLPRILVRHILPNTVAPLLVQGTYVCASAMITEAILSFIGAGTPPNIPSCGNIMADARSLVH